jgi:hypothetical protein
MTSQADFLHLRVHCPKLQLWNMCAYGDRMFNTGTSTTVSTCRCRSVAASIFKLRPGAQPPYFKHQQKPMQIQYDIWKHMDFDCKCGEGFVSMMSTWRYNNLFGKAYVYLPNRCYMNPSLQVLFALENAFMWGNSTASLARIKVEDYRPTKYSTCEEAISEDIRNDDVHSVLL